MKKSTKDALSCIVLLIVVALSPYFLFLVFEGMGCQFPEPYYVKQLDYLGVDQETQTYHWMDRKTGDCFSSDNPEGDGCR